MAKHLPRIIGTGYAFPEQVRLNTDPIFDWLIQNNPGGKPLFTGYDQRHVLGESEDLMTIMLPAAEMALKNANKKAGDIDMLLGYGSISDYLQPNCLTQLHQQLGLKPGAWVLPIGNDYSNYASCLLFADALIKAGHAKNILICIGADWTRNVSYHTPQSISAGDGAGAAVVSMSSDEDKWYVVDQSTVTVSANYGTMFTAGEQLTASPPIQSPTMPSVTYDTVYSPHFFQITAEGLKDFGSFGEVTALTAVTDLLTKNNLTGADITFMPHLTSQVLVDYWVKNLNPQPAQTLNSMMQFGNVTVATHAFNMAWAEANYLNEPILRDNMVMLALGPDMHANAMLLRRG